MASSRNWRRRGLAALVLLSPLLWQLGCDLWRRSAHIATYDREHTLGYAASFAGSGLFWAIWLYSSASRNRFVARVGAGVFTTLFALMIGVQSAFHAVFNIYLSHDCQIYARSWPQALFGYLPLSRPVVAAHLLFSVVLALAMVVAARHWLRPGRITSFAVPLVGLAMLPALWKVPASYRMWQSSAPDTIYVHGFVSHLKERLRIEDLADELRVQRRTPIPVPRIAARPPMPRNVLFILQESLRDDVVCVAYDPEGNCATKASNKAAPKRHPLQQMRSNASTTAISISNLWTGISPASSLEDMLSAPVLWDFADAAGYHGAYWTSQNVMFGSMRLYVQDFPVDHYAYGTNLDQAAHYDAGALDRLLTDRVIEDWDSVEEPFFGVVHYSNVHFPYVYEEEHAPFQPAKFSREPEDHEAFFNYYKDVAYLSDLAVGRLLEHVRKSDKGKRTVVLYTSDHGEAFREHWQIGHTSALYDEEIKVPSWIDAPEGTLTKEERASVVGARQRFSTHFDMHATMLDLMGVWDAPEVAPFRQKMWGRPLTRPEPNAAAVPLSNCAWIWQCGFRNWGMMRGSMKLEAREWMAEFNCFDLAKDPLEEHNLGEAGCGPMADLAREHFGEMPFQEWPSRKVVLWGPPPKKEEEAKK